MSRVMVEDKKISDAVHLLLKGGKMLGFHCQSCGTPLFQMEDDIFCPHCNKRYIIVERDGKKVVDPVDDSPVKTESAPKTNVSLSSRIHENLLEKVETLFDKIAVRALNSDNIHETMELVKLLKEIAEVIRLLKN